MGQSVSATTSTASTHTANINMSQKSQHIASLIQYARTHHTENPVNSLNALMQALELNSGSEAADQAKQRLHNELGTDLADHVLRSSQVRQEEAQRIVEYLLEDCSTLLHENGQRQDLLRQTMQDGSSVYCTKCQSVVASARWQQHQQYWCSVGAEHELLEEEDNDMQED